MTLLNSLKIYYQNSRGLRTKSHIFSSNVLLNNYDLIILTETWLTPDFKDAEYFSADYDVYRRDRHDAGGEVGGGVMIAVRSGMRVRRRNDWCSTNDSEELWLTLELSSAPSHHSRARSRASHSPTFIHIGCGYFPQRGAALLNALQLFFDSVYDRMLRFPDDSFLLLGDFNIPYALWSLTESSYLTLNTNNDPKAIALSDFMCLSNLKQFNNCSNANGRILDLVLSNCDCRVTVASPLTKEDPHHKPIEFLLSLPHSVHLEANVQLKYMFHAADYDGLRTDLANINWQMLNGMDTETAVAYFYSIIHKLIEVYVPKRKVFNDKHPIFYSRALIKLIREKLKIHSRWKKYNDPRDYQQFKLLRSREKKLQTECYNDYIKLSEEKITSSPKYFWSFIKSKFCHNNTPSYMTMDSLSATDGETICNLFNNYFHSVFIPASPPYVASAVLDESTYLESFINVSNIYITNSLVEKYLGRVDVNKGAGLDGVHPLFISKLFKELSIPLTIIYIKSLKEGHFPDIWKRALITPIPKGGDKHDVRQYRPISKLCVLGKIFEKIVVDDLSTTVSHHISQQQHGFFRGRSVDTNLVLYTDFLLNALDKGCQVDAVYTDFSKAFDKICHSTLLGKLSEFGIHGDLLRWLCSYISNRSQAVALKGYTSRFLEISSGIPQGSHLGPFLFTIYINDVGSCFHDSHHLLYADDTKIFKVISTPEDCLKLQSDLQRFVNYCEKDKLFLNSDKCFVISFTRKHNSINYDYVLSDNKIKRVHEIRDLGVKLDAKLHFRSHIDNIISRAYKQLGLILRLTKPFSNVFTYKILYYAFVRSLLEFACVVWCPQYAVHIARIEKLQNKFLKSLDYRTGNRFIDYQTSAKRYNIDSLVSRRVFLDEVFLYKIINGNIDSSSLLQLINFSVPRISSRYKETFYCDRSSTSYAKNTFIRRSCKFYNDKLKDVDIFCTSLVSYRQEVGDIIFHRLPQT